MSKKSYRLTGIAYFLVILFSGVMFYVGVHNVDMAHAIAIHHNDWNNAKVTKGYLNLRQYEDCNLFGCHRYQTFYMTGLTSILFTYILLFSVVLYGACFNGRN